MTKSDALPRIIIMGGGIGGLPSARALKEARAQVGLTDRSNHDVFQPLLYQVATGVLSPEHIAASLRQVLKETVMAVDAKKKLCVVKGGPVSLPYDYFVLATGLQTSYFGNEYIPFIPQWNLRGLPRSARVKTPRQKEVAGTCRGWGEPAGFRTSGKRRRNRWRQCQTSEETDARLPTWRQCLCLCRRISPVENRGHEVSHGQQPSGRK